jgi:hypothetical protein
MDYAVIMAGGSGKRLWPLSRARRPKQVLKLLDGHTLLSRSFELLTPIFDARNIQMGRTTGTKFGTAIDQKIGFFGTTPVDKPATVADPDDAGALYSQSQVQTIVDKVKTLIDRLQELGLIS